MKTSKKVLYIVIIFLLFFLALAIVGGNTSTQHEPQEQKVTPNSLEKSSEKSLREEMRATFIKNCNMEEANRQFCECTWDYLIENYGLDWLVDESLNTYKTGNIPPEVFEAGEACIQYIDISNI